MKRLCHCQPLYFRQSLLEPLMPPFHCRLELASLQDRDYWLLNSSQQVWLMNSNWCWKMKLYRKYYNWLHHCRWLQSQGLTPKYRQEILRYIPVRIFCSIGKAIRIHDSGHNRNLQGPRLHWQPLQELLLIRDNLLHLQHQSEQCIFYFCQIHLKERPSEHIYMLNRF